MNGYQCIMNAIEGKEVDRTPVWPFVMAFSAKYANITYSEFSTNYKALAKAQIKTAEEFDLDAIAVDSDAYREASACGAVLEFPQDDLPIIIKNAIIHKEDFKFKVPNISNSPRLVDKIEGVRFLKDHYKNEKAICGWIESPLQSAGTLYDLNDFMIDMYEDPGFIKELLDFSTELGINFAIEQINAGADIIGIGDAMASMVSPEIYENYILPYTKKLVSELKKRTDIKLKYHICGNALHILKYAREIGFDIISLDYMVDMEKAFEMVGDSICLKGNIDPVAVLCNGTATLVKNEADKLLKLNQPKFILSPGCEVVRDTPYENMHAMINSVK